MNHPKNEKEPKRVQLKCFYLVFPLLLSIRLRNVCSRELFVPEQRLDLIAEFCAGRRDPHASEVDRVLVQLSPPKIHLNLRQPSQGDRSEPTTGFIIRQLSLLRIDWSRDSIDSYL